MPKIELLLMHMKNKSGKCHTHEKLTYWNIICVCEIEENDSNDKGKEN